MSLVRVDVQAMSAKKVKVKMAVKAKAGEKKAKIAKPLPFVASKNSKKIGKKAPLVDSVVNTEKERVVDPIVR
jgi:hypothetical protein